MYQWPPYFAQKTHSAKWLAVCPPSRKNEKHKSMCSIGHVHHRYQAATWQIMAKSLNASTWVLSETSGLWHTSGWKILSIECSPILFNAHLRLWESKKKGKYCTWLTMRVVTCWKLWQKGSWRSWLISNQINHFEPNSKVGKWGQVSFIIEILGVVQFSIGNWISSHYR